MEHTPWNPRRKYPEQADIPSCPIWWGWKLVRIPDISEEVISNLLNVLSSEENSVPSGCPHLSHLHNNYLLPDETNAKWIMYALLHKATLWLVSYLQYSCWDQTNTFTQGSVEYRKHIEDILKEKEQFSYEDMWVLYSAKGLVMNNIERNFFTRIHNYLSVYFDQPDTLKLFALLKDSVRQVNPDTEPDFISAFQVWSKTIINNTFIHIMLHLIHKKDFQLYDQKKQKTKIYPKRFSQFSGMWWVYSVLATHLVNSIVESWRYNHIDLERWAFSSEFQELFRHLIEDEPTTLFRDIQQKERWEKDWSHIRPPYEAIYWCPLFEYFQELYEITLYLMCTRLQEIDSTE